MAPAEVEAYLHEHIPLSAAMEVRVTACDAGGATLRAPLAPNINHRSTVFGGSASAVAILAAWTWLNFRLRAEGHTARLVIQKNTVNYLRPIAGEFEARCDAPAPETVAKFLATFRRHGKARLEVGAVLLSEGRPATTFTGDYVAMTIG